LAYLIGLLILLVLIIIFGNILGLVVLLDVLVVLGLVLVLLGEVRLKRRMA